MKPAPGGPNPIEIQCAVSAFLGILAELPSNGHTQQLCVKYFLSNCLFGSPANLHGPGYNKFA